MAIGNEMKGKERKGKAIGIAKCLLFPFFPIIGISILPQVYGREIAFVWTASVVGAKNALFCSSVRRGFTGRWAFFCFYMVTGFLKHFLSFPYL